MLVLFLIVLVVGLVITVVLWAGSAFLQGYWYTEPSPGLAWQAPAVGGALALYLLLWCLLNAGAAGATASQVPYDALFRAQAAEDYDKNPAPKLWSYRKGEPEPTEYQLEKTSPTKWEYRVKRGSDEEVWRPTGVEAVEIPDKDNKTKKLRFERNPGTEGPYVEFVNAEEGWSMKGDTNIGLPSVGRWGRFIVILFLNLLHFALWFCGLWLVLRFEWPHALLLAVPLWLVMTIGVVPMLFNRAGAVAEGIAATAFPLAAAAGVA